jgi:predicted RNA-binding protein with RPS1 domain
MDSLERTVMTDLLAIGTVVRGEVVSHHHFGMKVRVAACATETIGIVDIAFLTDDEPFNSDKDYPMLGRQIDAVVLSYTPSGQLRLSTRASDLGRARGGSANAPQ